MNSSRFFQQLESFPAILSTLTTNLSDQEQRWRPGETDWSILETVCHLADEEVEDFRTRVRLTLLSPGEPWPSINPPQAAIDRRYQEQDFAATLRRFCDERTNSVTWLKQLQQPDWSATYNHPKLGIFHAGDLLSAWVAHDLLHLKQITKRIYQQVVISSNPFKTDYAGDWHA